MNLEKIYYYFDKELPEILCNLPLNEEKNIGIYGIGKHTKRLLHRYQIDVGTIKAKLIFIDSEKQSLIEKYNDCDIYNVCDIKGLALDAIILSSPLYEEEMYQKLQILYGNKYHIYRFYDKRKEDIFQVHGIYLEREKLKRLKVNFVDFWIPFNWNDHIFTYLLRDKYRIEISDEPEILICSQFGNNYNNYRNCKKILFAMEPIPVDFSQFDYVVGFQYFKNKKFYHYNCYEPWNSCSMQNRKDLSEYSFAKRKFCNFIYSNETIGEGAKLRKQFCIKLNEYKQVDCPGKVLNNMKNAIEPRDGDWNKSKYEFIKQYKFTIAFENYSLDGYTTEKLWHPLGAGSIPIYWGNPRIEDEICSDAIINCNAFDNDFDAIIQRIKEIDEDDEYYMYMLQKSPLKNSHAFDLHIDYLKGFLEKIIEE